MSTCREELQLLGLASFFFWQTHRSQRTGAAQSLVFRHRRPEFRTPQFTSPLDGLPKVISRDFVDDNFRCDVVLVISNASFQNRFIQNLRNQNGIGNCLNSITGPRCRAVIRVPSTSSLLVFVGNPLSVTFANGVGLACQSPCFTGHLKRAFLWRDVIFRHNIIVQATTGVDVCIGYVDLFNFFQIKQAFAVQHGVQGHDANGRFGGRLIFN